MQNKNQTSESTNSLTISQDIVHSNPNKNLRLDYSWIDEFFTDGEEPVEIAGAIRNLHLSFTRAIILLANNGIKFAVPDTLTEGLTSLNTFCDCLGCIDPNPDFRE